ncbi:OB-fold domain-containing protein [Amycolatopsis japonica]|uniref:Zn-ribbon domain-containing OB-fold protein n=1 Tax=Amycolatopsis japonica TaxID=208439 RepID=UPI0033C9A71A
MTEHAWPPITRDAKSGPFFDAAARDELLIKHCDRCARASAPDAAVCTGCGGTELSWVRAAGTATLVSWTVVHRAPNRAYTDLVPYTVGIVELTEGPWLHARVDIATPSAGMPLRAEFVHADGSESHPIFTAGA